MHTHAIFNKVQVRILISLENLRLKFEITVTVCAHAYSK